MFSFRSRGGPVATPPPVDDLSQAPLALLPAKSTSFLGENLEIDAQLRNSILVAGAGDARANGLYRRCGTQNDAPRWRHVDRSWLCILRDGSSWWIGAEKAAREDLYWCDAVKAAPPREEQAAAGGLRSWRVCSCDDRAHRHFRGSAPIPALSWRDAAAAPPEAEPLGHYAAEECPICLCEPEGDAARMPCGHVACALCLSRAKAMSPRYVVSDDCARCPLCRAPFALAGATHLATKQPLLEALPNLVKDGEKPMEREASAPRGGIRRSFVSVRSNPLSPSTRAAQRRPQAPDEHQPTRTRSNSGSWRSRVASIFFS